MQIAVEQCSAAIAMDPGLKSAHYNLALAYAASGDMGRAPGGIRRGRRPGRGELQPRHSAHGAA